MYFYYYKDIFARGYAYGEGHDLLDEINLRSYLDGGERPGGSILKVTGIDAKTLDDGLDLSGVYINPDGQTNIEDDTNREVKAAGVKLPAAEQSQSFSSPLRELNSMCFRGMSIAIVDGKRQVTLSKDHWGVNVYPGCRGARTGAMAFLKDMSYEKGEFDKIPLQ